MTGSALLTPDDIAQHLSRVAGRPIRYAQQTLDEAWASRKATGRPDWEIDGWVTSYAAIAAGETDVLSDTVPRLTGHEAQTLDEFLDQHPESYQHLLVRDTG